MDTQNLKNISVQIRKSVIESLASAGSGHLGGSLGLADVFTVLYFNTLNHKPGQPQWADRDRLVLSIGHVAPVLYASLAHAGYFPVDELLTLRKLGSRLQGHPGRDFGLPGIEVSSGSLGQGLSVSVGLALAAKMDGAQWKTFCILGDGELQEGSVWEAAMSAAHHKLHNLVAVVDRNNCQIDGRTKDVMELEPLSAKWRSFGWNVFECDGNDIGTLVKVFDEMKAVTSGPSILIANTLMGKGVKSIEDDYRWHGKVPNKEQALEFVRELEQTSNKIEI